MGSKLREILFPNDIYIFALHNLFKSIESSQLLTTHVMRCHVDVYINLLTSITFSILCNLNM